jgi:hypothetical protein
MLHLDETTDPSDRTASEDTAMRTEEPRALLSRLEVQTEDPDAIADDLQRTATQELLGTEDPWGYMNMQQALVIQTCVNHGRGWVKMLDESVYGIMVDEARKKMPGMDLYLERDTTDEGLNIEAVLEEGMRGKR